MLIYGPYIFVPIKKNASTAILRALGEVESADGNVFRYPHAKIAMWRDPHRRIESCYRMMAVRANGQPFAEWVIGKCLDDGGDEHLKPQAEFCKQNGQWFVERIIWWDFSEFADLFGVEPKHTNKSRLIETGWTPEAKEVFERTYGEDIAIWRTHAFPI